MKKGEATSRVRNVLKSVKEDPFLTDRFLYSLIMKYGKSLMYRDSKLLNIFKNSSLFKEIPCVELIDVDSVEACCTDIKTACIIKRSKYPLPKITVLDTGPVIRAVTTIDYSQQVHRTHPSVYANMTKMTTFKYNQRRYYWIINDYLFIPNVEWDAVRIQAMFDEDISSELCGVENKCTLEQELDCPIPEHLFTEIETYIRQELLLTTAQLPAEGADDNQSILR